MKKFLFYPIALLMLFAVIVACNDEKDLYKGPDTSTAVTDPDFDFSTENEITLNINYNLEGPKFSVAFEVYAENPLIEDNNGSTTTYKKKENLDPIYWDQTKTDGTFSKSGILLPAYAKTLYILSCNPLANPLLMTTEIAGNTATISAKTSKAVRSAKETKGKQTNELPSNIYTQKNGTTYNKWITLGNFDNKTGYPSYILDRNNPENGRFIYSDNELNGLYDAIGRAVDRTKSCPERYRQEGDLEFKQNSEMAITLLGGNTCWNSTLGYYYYTGEKPTNLDDLYIICVFPNTQDGQWDLEKEGTEVVGANRGDAVKLMYYPNIQNGGDLSGATTIFPKGTKLGFVLKNNGWGSQGKKYCYTGYDGRVYSEQNDFWACSTDGLTVNKTGEAGKIEGSKPRTAAFNYVTDDGLNQYTILAFEDFVDDDNFSDVTFSLKPQNAFTDLPDIVDQSIKKSGVYAFEDEWPYQKDFDMNDVIVNYDYSKQTQGYEDEDETEYKIMEESLIFKLYTNYATKNNGFGFTLTNFIRENENQYTSKIEIKRPGDTDFKKMTRIVIEKGGAMQTNQGENECIIETDENIDRVIVKLTNDVTRDKGNEYRITLTYPNGKNTVNNQDGEMQIEAFIFRPEGNSQWEVHPPLEAPTYRVDLTKNFGTGDDNSNIDGNVFYATKVTESLYYPFAFFLRGVSIAENDGNLGRLLESKNEKVAIDELYPTFKNWVLSGGSSYTDWYIKK